MLFMICVFFFKQKTAYEMRISDWSSDVCSSDLGCIPSKALLHASELYEEAAHGTLAKWGVKTGKVELDLGAMHDTRLEAIKGLTGGIEFLFKKNKVEWLKGHAAFTGKNSVEDRKSTRLNSSH